MKKVFSILFFFALILSLSCSKNEKSSNSGNAQLQIRLTDSPFPNVKAVWIDVRQIEIIMNETGSPFILDGAHPGMYNLMDFTNGRDTLLADASIPPGTISQIRLILGDNNYLITNEDEKIALKTPSAQESGLKVQVHQSVSGGILYRLILDFDAGKSIVKAGNSGNYLLKPVLRILSLIPSGGDIKGVVVPLNIRTAVLAINGPDTVSTAFTDPLNGNYLIKDVPAGSYSLVFISSDTTYLDTLVNAAVSLGQTTMVDTVTLHQ